MTTEDLNTCSLEIGFDFLIKKIKKEGNMFKGWQFIYMFFNHVNSIEIWVFGGSSRPVWRIEGIALGFSL